MIENVEHLSAKLNRVTFVDPHLLDEAEIYVLQPRPTNAVEACGSIVVDIAGRRYRLL